MKNDTSCVLLKLAICNFGFAIFAAKDSWLLAQLQVSQSPDSLTPGLTVDDVRAGWLSLFDGRSLFGWRAESKVDWQVSDGQITATNGDVGLLRTTTQFADFELRLEFRCDPETNSGVFLRTSPQPTDPAGDCYELNIADPTNSFPTGSFVARLKSAAPPASVDATKWHRLELSASGGQFAVSIDGIAVLNYSDETPLGRGYIGLQFNQGRVAFRNIAIRPLDLQPLFNGTDLSGWNTDQLLDSRISVTREGEMRMQGGRGQLESERKFADFALALECKTLAAGLNSGVFFRCIPGEVMNGYESQIHNVFLDDDPVKPADFGTGAIFRRQPARRVVAKDNEWFSMTIFATGPHFSVWVNGYQVTDWSDNREPHENPRNGLRTKAGTIILQGHDPTTDLMFRNLRAAELAPRKPK